MRIEAVEVSNYKSLRSVKLESIENPTVLIGKNGSGKSNLLELLYRFFAEIDLVGVPQGIDQNSWFDANQDRPIVASVTIRLDPEEFVPLWAPEVRELLTEETTKSLSIVRIVRSIEKPPTGWQSREVSLGGTAISVKGQYPTAALGSVLYTSGKLAEALFFDPAATKSTPSGNRVVVVPSNKTSFTMGAFSDGLVKTDQIPFRHVKVENGTWQDYLKVAGYSLPTGEFLAANYQALPGSIKPEHLQNFVTQLTALLKGKFRLVLAARDTPSQGPAVRVAYLDQETQTFLRTIGVSEARGDQRKWTQVRDTFRSITGGQLELQPSYLAVSQLDLRLPVQFAGGGDQSALTLLRHLFDASPIVAFEEPEAHMHPELVREFFGAIRKASDSKQIFVTTHSPVLVDQSSPAGTWLCRRKGLETTVQRVGAEESLRDVLLELGVRPSDTFFANAVLFVEGSCDRTFLLSCARALKTSLGTERVTVVPINGKGSGHYHLTVWLDAAKGVGIPYFMILDKGAEAEAKSYEKSGVLRRDRNLFTLKRGDIEDYYPLELLEKAFESVAGRALSPKEVESLGSGGGRVAKLETALGSPEKRPAGWKLRLAEFVGHSVTSEQVDGEIRTILETIEESLRGSR